MMPYITTLKVRKFHQSTINRFSTAGKKPVGGGGAQIGLKATSHLTIFTLRERSNSKILRNN